MIFQRLFDLLRQTGSQPSLSPRPELLRPSCIAQAINDERARLGLGPCKVCRPLQNQSQDWADRLKNNPITVTRIDGHVVHRITETGKSLDDIMAAWRYGPQRASILGRYNLIGVGVSVSDDGTITWCIDFDYTYR